MKDNILTRIVEDKKQWLQQHMLAQPLSSFKEKIRPSQRSFYRALQQQKERNACAFILECKKASPSRGLIRPDFDPQSIAAIYRSYATAISVLTDKKYFQGSFDYLDIVSQSTYQPVLCKDFIIDEYQVYLARYHQADAILLMLSILSDQQYLRLSQIAHQLNMGVLTEAISEEEIRRAIHLKAKVVGINNRDLRDMSINTERTKTLAPLLPEDTVVISESGIHHHQDVKALRPHADGFLIGSSLMAENNLEHAVRQIILGANKVCGLTRIEDATVAYEAGAVYGGLIFAPHSPRHINEKQAIRLVEAVPLQWVGVFVNEAIEHIVQLATRLQLAAVQLHGQEDEHYISELNTRLKAAKLPTQIWKALSIQNHIPAMSNHLVQRYLFDHGAGGTGEKFDWSLLDNASLHDIILAGGISTHNLKEALALKPYGVDLNSGVESAPGIKNKAKISDIFSIIRHY